MFLKLYLIALPVFILLDLAWIGFIARDFYAQQIGSLMKSEVNWVAVALFYLIFIAGLVFFVIMPVVQSGSWASLFFSAAFFGLVAYSAYDLTNLALTKDWPVLVTIIDLIWGVAVTSATSLVAYAVVMKTNLFG